MGVLTQPTLLSSSPCLRLREISWTTHCVKRLGMPACFTRGVVDEETSRLQVEFNRLERVLMVLIHEFG